KKVMQRVRTRMGQVRSGAVAERLDKLLAEISSNSQLAERLLVKSGERAFLLEVKKIDWIQAEKNYVTVQAGKDGYLLRGTLDGLGRRLDPRRFLRVNRSQIVNVDSIRELQPWFHGEYRIILNDGTEVIWKRRYLDKTSDIFIRKF
ncbi:MAG TPA: LytTR family DNA-binding domain-containing protein, partial [Anaerolineales bacterium]|nr:LytTR family DNA-binding domain-containing protein [Anaerolineales bacterium]